MSRLAKNRGRTYGSAVQNGGSGYLLCEVAEGRALRRTPHTARPSESRFRRPVCISGDHTHQMGRIPTLVGNAQTVSQRAAAGYRPASLLRPERNPAFPARSVFQTASFFFPFRPRMRFVIYGGQMFQVQLGVNLRGRQIAVPQQFLYRTDVARRL